MRRLSPALILLCCGSAETARCQQTPELVPQPTRVIRDSRGGRGSAFEIRSAILGQTRHVDIALPATYARTDRRYPVVVVLDGEAYLAPVAAVSEELTRNGLIPEAIIVAIENEDPLRGRVHDLTPPGLSVSGSSLKEGGDDFLDFIEKELLPEVDRKFRGGLPRTLIGHSSGGILATYAAATRPSFRAVVAIDAPIALGDGWLARKMIERAKADSVPLRFAYYQAAYAWPEKMWAELEAAAPRTWRLHKERFEREGHETAFMLAAYLGLREVFGDYSRFAAPVFPTTTILPHYKTLSSAFGVELVPPQRILRDVAKDLAMEGRGAAARAAYIALRAGYGAPPDSADLLADIVKAEAQPEPKETVEALLSAVPPTPEQARPYLGDWVGGLVNSDEQNTTLHIRIVAGKVVVELESPNAPPEFRLRRMDYLAISGTGISFGFMNGMRPRALILWEGVRKGNTIMGEQRWGGISMKFGMGRGPNFDPHFSFTKR